MPIDPSLYQDPCFVFGSILDGRGGDIPLHQADNLEAPHWLHIDYSVASAESWLLQRGLSPAVVDSLIRSDTRPRTLVLEEGLLVILRGVNHNPGADPEDMVSIRLWIEPGRIISVRQRKLLSAQDIHRQLQEGQGPKTTQELLSRLVERVADRIAEFVDAIEERIADYESALEAQRPELIRAEVSGLRRQIAAVRRYLAPQRDALDTLYRQSKGVLDEEHSYIIREQSDRIMRYVEDLDLARERCLVIQEELLNQVAQQQNNRMYVLSIVACVFLPITFISGVFGMNVAGLPGTESDIAFLAVSVIMMATTVAILAVFRLKRWL